MTDILNACLCSDDLKTIETLQNQLGQVDGLNVVAQATTWSQLRNALESSKVGLVTLDLDNIDPSGPALVAKLVSWFPGLPVLGITRETNPQSIITAVRAGCTQIVTDPIDPHDLQDAVDRIRGSRLRVRTQSKRICVVGASGGVGATSIVCNLAIELARICEDRCAVVDLNLEYGDVACMFDCEPTHTIVDVCSGNAEVDSELLSRALHPMDSGVSLLAAPRSFNKALIVNPESIEAALNVLRDMFPFAVVDLPRGYNFLSAATIAGTDHVLIITQLSVPIIRNTQRVYQYLLDMGVEEERVSLVVNRANASFENLSCEDVEAHFQRPILASIPNDYKHLRTALDTGSPLNHQRAASPSSTAIQGLARKLVAGEKVDDFQPAVRKGLINKLWSGLASANSGA